MITKGNDIEARYGPQSPADDPFTRKARLLQSYFRAEVLKEPMGVGPELTSTSRFGNMLREGAITGKNFLNEDVFNYARKKVYQKKDIKELNIDEYSLFNNMLSSMPLCFNLFYPFKQALDTHQACIHRAFRSIFPWLPLQRVNRIHIEYIPLPVEDYIDDNTTFDAVVLFEDEDRRAGLLTVEVKYTRPLNAELGESNARKADVAESAGIFTPQAVNDIQQSGCTQLMDNILLTESYRLKHKLANSQHVVLAPTDEQFSKQEVAEVQSMLLPTSQNKIARVTLERMIRAARKAARGPLRDQLDAFYARYLDFKKIKALL